MRIVFMGTPDFAVPCLKRLIDDGHQLAAVYTKPDALKNRGMKLSFSPVKELAEANGLKVVQPQKFSDPGVIEELEALAPELIVVVAYGKLLPQRVLDIPAKGCVNIHGSILPKYRGAAPIQRSVLEGEKVTGVTAMYMAKELDAGDIIDVATTEIGQYESSGELYERLSHIGAQLLSKTVSSIQNGTASRTPQNDGDATFAPMLTKEMSPIDWNKPAAEIINQIRGLDPWPVATCELAGRKLKVYSATLDGETSRLPAGSILPGQKLAVKVVCGDGKVVNITTLQAAGKKKMATADYLRGNPLNI